MKAIPGGARYTPAPQSSGMGRISPVQADAYFQNPYANTYGPFLPRPSRTFTDGAFAPFSPIQPVPVDEPPPGGQFADPRWWQYRVGWNLPTQPGTEGLKLASFDQLYTLANRYSVARACIELRKEEIRGLEWEITLTTDAAKAYQGDRKAMRDFGERKAEVTKFFKHPDPDYWSFSSFLDALLEEIFVYDALSVIFRPKYGASFGMGGRGLLGSDLDSINLVSGPCYSDDTEVLTRRGWLRFADTTAEDEFATRNPKTKTLEWQQATYFHREAWNGRLINFRSRWLDILVTPNHRMLSTSCPRGVKGERHGDEWIIPAGILAEKGSKFQLIPHTSINDSPDLASFRLPVSLQAPFGEMTGDDFAAFMGMWLAEGCVTWHGERGKRKRPTVYVTQDEKSRGFRPYRELLNRLFGRDVAYNGHSFYFRHAGLAGYLKQFGHAHEKFLPDEILGFSARQAEIFWHYYWLGDGYADRQRICTSSSRMADGLQILAQRMGKWATVSTEYAHDAKQLPGGRSIDQDHIRPKYLIALHSHAASTWSAEYTDYDGFVYCVSLPNETMYVRRNGKPAWCCNTIRPLLDMHGGRPRPPAPAYQQYLYGVPRSDYMTIAMGNDIDAYGLSGAEVNEFRSDVMLYAPLVSRRETPYGFPPVERALLPIISGLQKQEFQLDYFTEGTIPAVYISPGDTNITPTQIGELQNALNALAGDPAYHLKVVVLPPGSKVEPQRPVDLSDSFDYLVMNQVAMQFDVQPQELGIIPDIGSNATGPSASAVRFAGQEGRDLKSRKSTKPLLSFICDIFNYAIQDICRQPDMQFTFEGLVDDEDKQVIVDQGVQMIQNGLASIDEVREQLDKPPWGLQETSEPVVFTAQGPVPFSMAPQLIMMAAQGKTNAPGQGTNSGQNSKTRPSQPAVRAGGQTKPNGSHPAPVSPHREAPATPGHAAAAGAVQSPTPRTGGTTSRNSVAGSRKKAALSELESLKRHLRKGRSITTWEPVNITNGTLSMIAEDVAKGVLLDVAVERAASIAEDIIPAFYKSEIYPDEGIVNCFIPLDDAVKAERQFPGWEQDLGLVGRYREEISQAFRDAEIKGSQIRKDAATGKMWVSAGTLHGLISDATIGVFGDVMVPMWRKAWNLGYEAGNQLLGKSPGQHDDQVQAFIDTEGAHWLDQVSRTGLGNSNARSEIIARTEIARAMNAGAIQAYKEAGVSYKHLGVAPDERECEICKDAEDDGIIPLDAPFSSGGLSGPLHPNCVIGSTRVTARTGILGTSIRDYVGKFITIRTASGDELTATPNHPIATRCGWVPIAELKVGDNVLRSTCTHWPVDSVYPDVNDIPTRIEDIAKACPVTLAAMPVSPEDFHGDGSGSEICIVKTDRLLVDDGDALGGEMEGEHQFGSGHVDVITSFTFDTLSPGEQFFPWDSAAPDGFMGGSGKTDTLLRGRMRHAGIHSLTAVPGLDASFQEGTADRGAADSESFCERLLAFSSEIALDEIVHVECYFGSANVYNLETSAGWYIANSIVTHNCRCVPLPAGIDAEPPQAHIGKRFMTVDEARQLFRDSLKNNDPEDESRVAWLLIRARDENDHWRYLLQQRDDGQWGMPGGTTHVGEDGFHAAFRETTEEIGDLPPLNVVRNFNHTDPDGKQVYLYLCETGSVFTPRMNGSTPEETAGTGWFRRKEIGDLDLTDKFRGDWEDEVHLEQALKMISPSLSGEILVDPAQNAQGGGARWPYPHRADGTEDPLHWDDAGPGAVPDEHGSAGGEPPHDDNFADRVNARGAPEGGRDGEFPRRRTRNKPASRFPSPETDGKYPQGGIGSAQPPGTSVPGNIKQGAPHPIVGSIPAKTPKPYNPRSVPPETFDTSDVVQEEGPDGNNVIAGKSDADLADPRKPGGPSDYDDPNETDPEHILSQLRSNFPEKSIQWAKNARWVGPVEIPWERVDADSIDSWAASHQPSAVNRFAADIKANRGHTNPSIMVQRPGKDKAFIVDGHHRALARRKLGKPVLAYVGFIQGKDVQAAEETHSSQFHSGTDPENR
jgi:8-oxo-dGTP pyrophosphatase MutT (NUDIX family)